jgi:hypothetical protein
MNPEPSFPDPTPSSQRAVYPSRWKEFIATTKRNNRSTMTDANRFAARYRIATGFTSASFDGVAQDTAEGFSVLLKVMLAANAMEAVITLQRRKLHDFRIADESLAKDMRKHAGALLDLLLTSAGEQHKPRLQAIKSDESNDVWIIARSVRNTLAHGILTSNGAGVTRSKRQRALHERLATAVLRAADEHFSDWFEALELGLTSNQPMGPISIKGQKGQKR